MHVEVIKWLFIIISSILAVMLILLDMNITKKMKPMKASEFVSSATAGLMLYIVLALTLAVILPGISIPAEFLG